MKITDHVHQLKQEFQIPIGPGQIITRFVNIFLLEGKNGLYLIDSGVAASLPAILDYPAQLGRDSKEISLLLLSHSHPDHIGSAKSLKETLGLKVAAHAAESGWITDVGRQNRERPVPGFDRLVAGSVAVDLELTDGRELALEPGLTVKVLHTPGHSAGSLSFLMVEDRVLFTGDALPVPGDLPVYEDLPVLWRTLDKLEQVQDVRCLVSSWDRPRSDAEVGAALATGREYVRRVHDSVRRIMDRDEAREPMAFCRLVAADLGLPPAAANPMVLKTFEAHAGAEQSGWAFPQ